MSADSRQTGRIQNYNLQASGGTPTASYLISGSYLDQNGTILNTNFHRVSVRANSDATRGRFHVGENLAVSQAGQQLFPNGIFGSSTNTRPLEFPLIDAVLLPAAFGLLLYLVIPLFSGGEANAPFRDLHVLVSVTYVVLYMAVAFGSLLTYRRLDLDLGGGDEDGGEALNLKAAREAADRRAIRKALASAGNNISNAAKLLGISRPTLYDLLKQYGLQP